MQFVAEVGAATERSVTYVGGLAQLFGKSVRLLFLSPLKRSRLAQRAVHQAMAAGVGALPIISLITFFVGVIIALQGAYQLQRLGAIQLVASLVSISITRELGPLVTAIVVIGRSGSAFAAEIGTMRVTEELDALETMALDPFKYLITPKFVAAMISMPLLCAIFDVVGIYGGWLVGVKLLGVNPGAYFYEMEKSVVWRDVYSGMVKSFSFGVIIAWIGCYKGYFSGHGAEGVSRATTESVVLTSVIILVWDYFLTSILL